MILALPLMMGCSGAKDKIQRENTDAVIMSEKFRNTDSLVIQIVYKELNGCIDLRFGNIVIKQNNGRVVFAHQPTDELSHLEHFISEDINIMDPIIAFEKEAKELQSKCGGFSGGTGYEIDLKINQETSNFGFCKEEYDGITMLVEKIKVLMNKSNTYNIEK